MNRLNDPTQTRDLDIATLWYCADASLWFQALERYWDFVSDKNFALEKEMEALNAAHVLALDERTWFNWLHDKYFPWKYTAPNRLASTRIWLCKDARRDLYEILCELSDFDLNDIKRGLSIAKKIKGLGTAGASGLLALLFPIYFGTVDQFALQALLAVPGLPNRGRLSKMNKDNLRLEDGVILIEIMRKKAAENGARFGSHWTPRMIDKVLWASRASPSPKRHGRA